VDGASPEGVAGLIQVILTFTLRAAFGSPKMPSWHLGGTCASASPRSSVTIPNTRIINKKSAEPFGRNAFFRNGWGSRT
jgi:hypothetical protein